MASDLAVSGANALLAGTAMGNTLYVQAHSGDPGSTGIANVISGVGRQNFTRTAAVNGVTSNATLIQWLDWSSTETITHISIWSDIATGFCWFVNNVDDEVTSVGATVRIQIGLLTITFPVWT